MKTVLVLSSVIILWVASFAQAAPQSSEADAQAMIAKSKAVLEAIKAKDVQTLNGLLADNFRSVNLAGDFGSRQEMLGLAHEGFMKDFLFYNPRTFRIDNDSILVSYNAAITLSDAAMEELVDDNITWPRYSKVSDLWVREGSEWKLKFEQITPVRAMY
jgi:hypothetical protein